MKNIIKLNHPAAEWVNGLPIGNGKLGAMVLGQIREETLLINEETMYYGGPKERSNPDTIKYLGEIRKLLWANKYEEAELLAKTAMAATPKYLSPFQPACSLIISFSGHQNNALPYLRTLDLDNAAASVSYEMDGASYVREYIASFDENVIVYSVTGTAPITLKAYLDRNPFDESSGRIDGRTIGIWGRCGNEGVRYFGCARMAVQGGECSVMGDSLVIKNARSLIIYLSWKTDYAGNSAYREQALEAVNNAELKGYQALKNEHQKIYKSLFDRVSLSINDVQTPDKYTDLLINELQMGNYSDYLCALDFNMGRYLLICSSYNCRLPANLQGIWNGSFTPPWGSIFFTNINIEMNYWPAEVCNLSECHLPLFNLLDILIPRGKEAAKKLYGCRGFVAHHNVDIWGDPDPSGAGSSSPFWPMGGAWLALHLYEHYLFTLDRDFLSSKVFPVIEQALIFFNDYLTADSSGVYHTGPSLSPENTFVTNDGQKAAICMSPAMDIQILKELFAAFENTCDILGQESNLRNEIAQKIKRLPEIKLTKDGRIREWLDDFAEADPGHRHVSHLFALHPGSQITEKTPELLNAAEKTLLHRIENGSGHTGWSAAWMSNFWARLKKGNMALKHIMGILGGKTIENMLNIHPPFQIDGSFGLTAAIAEMLVQSHAGYCELLPALPDAWKKGHVKGLRIRGAVTVDIFWENGKLTEAAFLADQDTGMDVRYGSRREKITLQRKIPVVFK
ncbi:MAG: glycoside hydrolase family 95 protein [Treponema sp.]|nr:glycoside hydrolase family 95 protein [Treponema sp.]